MWKHVNSIQFTDDVLPYVRMSLDCVADILAVDWLFKHQNHWVPAQVLSLVESSKQQRSTIGYSEDLRSRMIKAKNHQRSLWTVRFFFSSSKAIFTNEEDVFLSQSVWQMTWYDMIMMKYPQKPVLILQFVQDKRWQAPSHLATNLSRRTFLTSAPQRNRTLTSTPLGEWLSNWILGVKGRACCTLLVLHWRIVLLWSIYSAVLKRAQCYQSNQRKSNDIRCNVDMCWHSAIQPSIPSGKLT